MRLQFRISRFSKTLVYQTLQLDTSFYNEIFNLLPSQLPQPKRSYTASNGLKITMLASAACNITTVLSTSEMIFGTQTNASTATFTNDTLRDQAFDKIVSALKELYIFGDNGGTIPQTCEFCMNRMNAIRSPNRFCYWIEVPDYYWNYETDKCSHFNSIHNDLRKFDIHTI